MCCSQLELGEVLEDVEYINDSDEENDIEQSPQSCDVASVPVPYSGCLSILLLLFLLLILSFIAH